MSSLVQKNNKKKILLKKKDITNYKIDFCSNSSYNIYLFPTLQSTCHVPLLCICFAAVSAKLEDSLASSAKATLQAIGAQEAALQAITQHTHKLKTAMEAEVQKTLSKKTWYK